MDVSFTKTFAPITGSPDGSVTIPVTFICAKATLQINNSAVTQMNLEFVSKMCFCILKFDFCFD